jgi:hypothetical protein
MPPLPNDRAVAAVERFGLGEYGATVRDVGYLGANAGWQGTQNPEAPRALTRPLPRLRSAADPRTDRSRRQTLKQSVACWSPARVTSALVDNRGQRSPDSHASDPLHEPLVRVVLLFGEADARAQLQAVGVLARDDGRHDRRGLALGDVGEQYLEEVAPERHRWAIVVERLDLGEHQRPEGRSSRQRTSGRSRSRPGRDLALPASGGQQLLRLQPLAETPVMHRWAGNLRRSGGGRIRTCEGRANGFTVRPL